MVLSPNPLFFPSQKILCGLRHRLVAISESRCFQNLDLFLLYHYRYSFRALLCIMSNSLSKNKYWIPVKSGDRYCPHHTILPMGGGWAEITFSHSFFKKCYLSILEREGGVGGGKRGRDTLICCSNYLHIHQLIPV